MRKKEIRNLLIEFNRIDNIDTQAHFLKSIGKQNLIDNDIEFLDKKFEIMGKMFKNSKKDISVKIDKIRFEFIYSNKKNINCKFYNILGLIYYHLYEYFEDFEYKYSKGCFNTSLKLTAQNEFAFIGLGMICKKLGDIKKSIFYFNKARKISPNSYIANKCLAEIYLHRNNWKRTRQFYKNTFKILYWDESIYWDTMNYMSRDYENFANRLFNDLMVHNKTIAESYYYYGIFLFSFSLEDTIKSFQYFVEASKLDPYYGFPLWLLDNSSYKRDGDPNAFFNLEYNCDIKYIYKWASVPLKVFIIKELAWDKNKELYIDIFKKAFIEKENQIIIAVVNRIDSYNIKELLPIIIKKFNDTTKLNTWETGLKESTIISEYVFSKIDSLKKISIKDLINEFNRTKNRIIKKQIIRLVAKFKGYEGFKELIDKGELKINKEILKEIKKTGENSLRTLEKIYEIEQPILDTEDNVLKVDRKLIEITKDSKTFDKNIKKLDFSFIKNYVYINESHKPLYKESNKTGRLLLEFLFNNMERGIYWIDGFVIFRNWQQRHGQKKQWANFDINNTPLVIFRKYVSEIKKSIKEYLLHNEYKKDITIKIENGDVSHPWKIKDERIQSNIFDAQDKLKDAEAKIENEEFDEAKYVLFKIIRTIYDGCLEAYKKLIDLHAVHKYQFNNKEQKIILKCKRILRNKLGNLTYGKKCIQSLGKKNKWEGEWDFKKNKQQLD